MNIGTIIQWASNTIPDGWLLCDGSAVSRTTYSDLFTAIGTTFGTGDGSTTFNLPDLRGKVGVGKNTSDTDFDTLGETGGEKTHTLTTNEMPSHHHNTNIGSALEASTGDWGLNYGSPTVKDNLFRDSSDVGGGQAHNNLQPYIVLNYIIKAVTQDSIKISDLNTITTLDDSDILPVVDVSADETKKITFENLKENFADIYSTSEIDTGKKWIDGKTIYSKTILVNRTSSDDLTYSLVFNSNETIDTIINIETICRRSNMGWPFYRVNEGDQYSFYISNYSQGKLQITAGANFPGKEHTANITMYYTKTN